MWIDHTLDICDVLPSDIEHAWLEKYKNKTKAILITCIFHLHILHWAVRDEKVSIKTPICLKPVEKSRMSYVFSGYQNPSVCPVLDRNVITRFWVGSCDSRRETIYGVWEFKSNIQICLALYISWKIKISVISLFSDRWLFSRYCKFLLLIQVFCNPNTIRASNRTC